MPRPNNGAGHRDSGQKSAEFLLHMLKIAESDAELKGLDVESLVTEHIQGNKAPENLQSSRPNYMSSPTTLR